MALRRILLALLALWFGISVPLVFLGAYFGYRRKAVEFPVRVNQIGLAYAEGLQGGHDWGRRQAHVDPRGPRRAAVGPQSLPRQRLFDA